MKQRLTILLGILISVALLALLLADVDFERLGEALATANYGYIILGFLIISLGHVTRGARWRALLEGRLPLWQAFSILNISYLFNGVLPFRLGEVARMFLTTRLDPPVPVFTTLSTILVERLLDLLTVLAMLGIVLATLPLPEYITAGGLALGLGSLAAMLVLVLFANRRAWAFRFLRAGLRLLPFLRSRQAQIEGLLERFLDGLSPLTSLRGVFAAVFWSVVSWGFSSAAGYVMLYALYPQPEWSAVLLMIAMAALALAVPYAPGAVGPYEAGVVVALTLTGFGEPEGTAVAFAIILHMTNLAVNGVLGVMGLLHEGISLGQVAQGARQMNRSNAVSTGSK